MASSIFCWMILCFERESKSKGMQKNSQMGIKIAIQYGICHNENTVLTPDWFSAGNYEGIKVVNVVEWLLEFD